MIISLHQHASSQNKNSLLKMTLHHIVARCLPTHHQVHFMRPFNQIASFVASVAIIYFAPIMNNITLS